MAKIVLNNVRINARSGGSIKNCDVEISDTEMTFTESSIDISTDESVAIIEQAVKSGHQPELVEIIKALQKVPSAQHEEIVKKSFLGNLISGEKDLKPFIELLLEHGAKYLTGG